MKWICPYCKDEMDHKYKRSHTYICDGMKDLFEATTLMDVEEWLQNRQKEID